MENDVKRVFSRNLEWVYSSFDDFVVQLEYKEKKCDELNKNRIYSYVMQSSLSFGQEFPFRITIKVYKKV
jgi:hypothetical protein